MTDKSELYFNPIVDGDPPTMDTITILFLGVLALLALVDIYHGEYASALSDVVIIGLIWVYERLRRQAYIRGHRAAVESFVDQLSWAKDDGND